MIEIRTRTTGFTLGGGRWNYPTAPLEDGVSGEARSPEQVTPMHLTQSLCTSPTAQG
ncbi:MAG: hypothetical protein QGI78_03860 [Phycisphaerales bacterium]|jgi:hypothetical protein|nr:hypothetical protein [Phycisphaerales bacterium]